MQTEARPDCPTSVTDLSSAFMSEWEQTPAAKLQKLVENLPRRVETFANRMLMCMCNE